MRNNKMPKVALVKPPLPGHKYRGTGEYTQRLYAVLKKTKEVDISLVNIRDNLEKVDLVHYPYFDPFFLTLPLFPQKPTVVTVHDLIPLKFPKFFPSGIKGSIKWQVQKFALSRSWVVITDSWASKRDLIKYTGIDREKIEVVYLGVSEEFKIIESEEALNNIREKFRLPQEFFLHVGDVNYNKNIPALIKAFQLLSRSNPLFHLVLVGRGFVTPSPQLLEIIQLIDLMGLGDKIHRFDHLATDELVGFYNLAKVYLQPSLAEGFGLPVLEAMACGCPTVIGEKSSLPEIAGRAAILVNPYKVDSILKGMLKVLHFDTIKYRSKVKMGLEQAKKFSWKKCAKKTLRVYKKVLFD